MTRIPVGGQLRRPAEELYVDAPDMYCVTLPDGSCVSRDPRCMHWPDDYEHGGEA